MKIVTWNVNSLKARHDYVARYLDAENPDVIGLQELKLENDKVPTELFESRGYQIAIHGQKQYNGVAIASKTELNDLRIGFEPAELDQARIIAATVKRNGQDIRIINLYCPQGSAVDSPKFPYKLTFFDELINYVAAELQQHERLIVMGDINIAPNEDDIFDPEGYRNIPSFHPEEHKRLAALMQLGLSDCVKPYIQPNTYSFWDYRNMAFRFDKGMRIDLILPSSTLNEHIKAAGIERNWRKKVDGLSASDHAPVWVEIE